MDRPQAVIFDLDGTLLDTLADLATSGNEVLTQHGMPTHPVESYRTFIGDGMASLVQRIFPEEHRPADGPETDAILAEYRAAYDRHWQDTTCLFPGIADLLDSLKAAQIPIGVLSNKAHDFTVKCVEAFLADWQWDAIYGARDGVAKKPDPAGAVLAAREMGTDPAECYFIGDSDVDMLTAVNATMHPIGVTWGFRSVEELREHGAETILENPIDLIEWMSR